MFNQSKVQKDWSIQKKTPTYSEISIESRYIIMLLMSHPAPAQHVHAEVTWGVLAVMMSFQL